jgi:hypothetical protein
VDHLRVAVLVSFLTTPLILLIRILSASKRRKLKDYHLSVCFAVNYLFPVPSDMFQM